MKLPEISDEDVAAGVAARLTKTNLLKPLVNEYGNIRLGNPLPKGLVAITGETNARLRAACRKTRTPWADLLGGFTGRKKYGYRPYFNGIVIHALDIDKLLPWLAPELLEQRRAAHREAVYSNDEH